MKEKLVESKALHEIIVIPDECGDSMWDAVLEQEVKSVLKNASSFLNKLDAVEVSDTTKA